MIFFGFGGAGLIFLIPALFIMFSKSGAKWVLPFMWVLLVADLLVGSLLFAGIQAVLLAMAYGRRRNVAGPAAPPPDPPDPFLDDFTDKGSS
jgi:hypothetical protein